MSGEAVVVLERRLAEAKARSDLLEALYTHAAHDLELTKRELDLARRELESLSLAHNSLLGSTSWRCTAPLRALIDFIGRRSS